ncbi:sensor histidine kinase [Paenibacillus albicereus]|uniref:sensor histidine kinase n=1 Tax=Paenibacillus albicereus TaxID=2726185 RepID=UPI001F2E6FA7|nr:sensor histidine kinase [Paenibacillus albicereus]
METKKRFIPLGIKLFASYMLLTIVPLAVLGYIASTVLSDSVRSQTESSLRGTLRQMEDNIQYKVNDTKRLSDVLYFDNTLSRSIRHAEAGWVSYEATKKVLMPKFSAILDSTDRKMRLSVYLKNEALTEIYYTSDPGEDIVSKKGRFYEMLHLSRIENEAWYQAFPAEKYGSTLVWQQVGDDAEHGRISLIRRLVDMSQATRLREVGMIRISVYLSDLFESVDVSKLIEGSELHIEAADKQVKFASGSSNGMTAASWKGVQMERYMMIEDPLPKLDYKLVAAIPIDVLESGSRKITWVTMLVCVVSAFVIAAVALTVTQAFIKRINKIIQILQAFSQGNYSKRVRYRGHDEFAQIADSLNALGARTDNLIQEVYMTNLRKKEAELESLQAQINPHFLYNTLSSISRLAKFGEVDKQHQMIMNLARFYRMTLNDGKTIISASHELEQIQAYLAIQQVKYGERVRVSYEWDSRVDEYRIIKLLLQPFVENALEHAWRGDRIELTIGARLMEEEEEDPRLEFRVRDDGIGMPQDLVKELFSDRQPARRGYGIRNVHERIQLYYGAPYGVSIESDPAGGGTLIRLCIPARRGVEGASASVEELLEEHAGS